MKRNRDQVSLDLNLARECILSHSTFYWAFFFPTWRATIPAWRNLIQSSSFRFRWTETLRYLWCVIWVRDLGIDLHQPPSSLEGNQRISKKKIKGRIPSKTAPLMAQAWGLSEVQVLWIIRWSSVIPTVVEHFLSTVGWIKKRSWEKFVGRCSRLDQIPRFMHLFLCCFNILWSRLAKHQICTKSWEPPLRTSRSASKPLTYFCAIPSGVVPLSWTWVPAKHRFSRKLLKRNFSWFLHDMWYRTPFISSIISPDQSWSWKDNPAE